MENKTRVCENCGKAKKAKGVNYRSSLGKVLCNQCYKVLKLPVHPLPQKGEVKYDEFGKFICHICGRPFTSAGHHISGHHGMTIAEYKEKFGLNKKQPLTSLSYHKRVKERPQNQIDKNNNRLHSIGARDREKASEISRKKRLQARKDRYRNTFHETCYIGIEQENGMVDYVYCYSDGGPKEVGTILLDHYTNRMSVETLVSLGDFPKLKEDIKDIKPYFKGQERKSINIEKFMSDCEELEYNYKYVYTLKNEWMVRDKNNTFVLNFLIKEILD